MGKETTLCACGHNCRHFYDFGAVSNGLLVSLFYGNFLDNQFWEYSGCFNVAVFIAGSGLCIPSLVLSNPPYTWVTFVIVTIGLFLAQFGSTGLIIAQTTWGQDMLPGERTRKIYRNFECYGDISTNSWGLHRGYCYG